MVWRTAFGADPKVIGRVIHLDEPARHHRAFFFRTTLKFAPQSAPLRVPIHPSDLPINAP